MSIYNESPTSTVNPAANEMFTDGYRLLSQQSCRSTIKSTKGVDGVTVGVTVFVGVFVGVWVGDNVILGVGVLV